MSVRASSAPPPCSASRKNAHAPFAEALDQARLDQQSQMPRDAGLRLAQDLGQVGDRQFGLRQQHQNAQPRVLTRRFQGGVEGIERQTAGFTHGKLPTT